MNILQYILTRIGFRYIVNLNTGEIHDSQNRQYGCHLELMKHKRFITEKQMHGLIERGFDGCRWCMPKYNKEHIFSKSIKKKRK